tara:strand:- start:466 stop:672 length:207 start_codon:yes stop_codon:yes gene_type:complete
MIIQTSQQRYGEDHGVVLAELGQKKSCLEVYVSTTPRLYCNFNSDSIRIAMGFLKLEVTFDGTWYEEN